MTYPTQSIVVDFQLEDHVASKTFIPRRVRARQGGSLPWSKDLPPSADDIEIDRKHNEGGVAWMLANPMRFIECDSGEIVDVSKLDVEAVKLRRLPITLEAKAHDDYSS